MKRLVLLVPLCLACASTQGSKSASTSQAIAQLQALEKQESWDELRASLKTVPPTDRDAEWERLVERAAIVELDAVKITDTYSGENALAVISQQASSYPSLKKSAAWLDKRVAVGSKAFGWTYSNYRHSIGDEKWVPQIKAFVEADTVTKGLAQKMARDVVLNRLVASSAWPLYAYAFEREGDAVCTDPKLPDVVFDIIDSEAWIDEMKALVTKRCASQLKQPVIEKLKKNESKGFRKGACKVLEGQADAADALKICSA